MDASDDVGSPPGQPFDIAATDRLLTTTRSVRKRLDLDRPVEPEVLLDCLRLAVQAPTGSNSQGWRWIVVTDEERRQGLAELYRKGGMAYLRAAAQSAESAGSAESAESAEGRQPGPGRQGPRGPEPQGQQARVLESARHLLDVIDRVPVLVIPCLQGRINAVRHAAAFFGSIHPAIWSFQLALRSRGLGSVLTTFHLAYEQEAAELLDIPGDVTQAALLPVAYTIGTDFRPAKRRPVEELTYWNSWGTRA